MFDREFSISLNKRRSSASPESVQIMNFLLLSFAVARASEIVFSISAIFVTVVLRIKSSVFSGSVVFVGSVILFAVDFFDFTIDIIFRRCYNSNRTYPWGVRD